MKIALSSSGDSLESPFETRFGRCRKFIVFNDSDDSLEVVDNTQNLDAAQGAGIQAAQNVANAGVQCVVSGHCGPKAFMTLDAAGIKVYTCESRGSVAEALDAFKKGELPQLAGADVDGHW